MNVISRIECASAQEIFLLAGRIAPWFAVAAALFCLGAIYIGFVLEPDNLRHWNDYRILLLHVPAAVMSMMIYLVIAFCVGLWLVHGSLASAMMISAVAPTGAMFAVLALWTGSLWVKSTTGIWWNWNPLFVSELILLLLYLSIMALQATSSDLRRTDRAVAMLTLVGVVNIPMIYSSHHWQSGLHPGMQAMVVVMLLLMSGFCAYTVAMVSIRVRCILLEYERGMRWAADYAKGWV